MRVAYLYFMTDNPDRCSELVNQTEGFGRPI